MREKVGGVVVVRADDGRTVSLCITQNSGGKVLAAAGRSDETTAERKSGKGDSAIRALRDGADAAVPSLPQVLQGNGLPQVAPLARGERIMLERKRLDGFYQELQTSSRIEANTAKPQAEETKKRKKMSNLS